MSESKFHRSLKRYLNGTASQEEQKSIEHFYLKNQQKNTDLNLSSKEKENRKLNLLSVIRAEKQLQRRTFVKQVLRVAASLILLLAAGYWIFNTYLSETTQEVEWLTISTARGERKTISLPDGSTVKLNSRSSISFPQTFSGAETRAIQLNGEAFFDVKRNEEQPFEVTSGTVLTRVLGTSFNVDAYEEREDVMVTVATGKVEVSLGTSVVELVHGDQAYYQKTTENLQKLSVDLFKVLAWKNNQIVFEDADLVSALRVLEDWYDVQIRFNEEELETCTITGNYGGSERLANILESMQFINGLTYEWEADGSIRITGNQCTANEGI